MAIICDSPRILFIMVPGTGCSAVGKLLVRDFGGRYLPEQDVLRDGKVVHHRKHNTVDQLLADGLVTREELDSYLVVATVRNPFDRLVTYYQRLVGDWVDYSLGVQRRQVERRKERVSTEALEEARAMLERRERTLRRRQRLLRAVGFNQWLIAAGLRILARPRNAPGRPDALEDFLFPMLSGVDVVIRSEQLEQGLNEILQMSGIERRVTIPRENVTQGKRKYTEYYSAFGRRFATLLFRRTMERFEYAFGIEEWKHPICWLNQKSPAGVTRRSEVLD